MSYLTGLHHGYPFKQSRDQVNRPVYKVSLEEVIAVRKEFPPMREYLILSDLFNYLPGLQQWLGDRFD